MTRGRFLWAIGAMLVTFVLFWQVRYELGIRACEDTAEGYLVPLCAGPIDAWVLPATVSAAFLLLAAGLLRIRS